MQQYLDTMKLILNEGTDKPDRTGVGTRSLFGCQMSFDLEKGFPLLTTKKVHVKSVLHELLWFLSGDTNTGYLTDNGVSIWNEWANQDGDLGPVYGHQWRSWAAVSGHKIDQIENLIRNLKNNPDSRRHIVSAWNVGELDQMALPPCHAFFQFYVANNKLSCKLTQRSADFFLGVPFNIASYAFLTHMVAQQCDMGVDKLIWSGGDCHLYHNHFNQVELQLSRQPGKLCRLEINRKPSSIFDYQYDDFTIIDYDPQPVIKAPIAV